MTIQVCAHGFEMTEALKVACIEESKEKLVPIAMSNFSAKWTLSLERDEHVAHAAWSDGVFRGNATAKSQDMYGSIKQCSKKIFEQLKKAHNKKRDNRYTSEEICIVDEE